MIPSYHFFGESYFFSSSPKRNKSLLNGSHTRAGCRFYIFSVFVCAIFNICLCHVRPPRSTHTGTNSSPGGLCARTQTNQNLLAVVRWLVDQAGRAINRCGNVCSEMAGPLLKKTEQKKNVLFLEFYHNTKRNPIQRVLVGRLRLPTAKLPRVLRHAASGIAKLTLLMTGRRRSRRRSAGDVVQQ